MTGSVLASLGLLLTSCTSDYFSLILGHSLLYGAGLGGLHTASVLAVLGENILVILFLTSTSKTGILIKSSYRPA